MEQDKHIGYHTTGREFLRCADELEKLHSSRFNAPELLAPRSPVYFLYYHSMELFIKSFILLKNGDEKELKNIGHDIKAAWNRASELGIEKIYPENQVLQECIEIASAEVSKGEQEKKIKLYENKALEYYYPGFRQYPSIKYLKDACNSLEVALFQHYKSK